MNAVKNLYFCKKKDTQSVFCSIKDTRYVFYTRDI